jgi:hypothetical protein
VWGSAPGETSLHWIEDGHGVQVMSHDLNVAELAEVAKGLTTAPWSRLAAAKILAGRVLLPHGRIPDEPGLRVPRIDAYRDLSDSD